MWRASGLKEEAGLDNLDDLKEALPDDDEAKKEGEDVDDLDLGDVESFGVKKKKKKSKKVNLDELGAGEEERRTRTETLLTPGPAPTETMSMTSCFSECS